ncbi:MAG TPA: carbon-nitrogen hydrolase family protein, partial [Planctomycetota bacterium]|nr:carbon-nitrogen hydrolase family protein [Planctomycetota bacterium]
MTRKGLKVGLGQIRVAMGDKKANLVELLHAVDEASKSGCDVVVLPECSLAGWLSPSARSAAESIPGPVIHKLVEAARRHRMAIVAGLEEREDSRVYNSAVFIDRHGEILSRHRKIHELEIGHEVYSRGTSLGTFGFEGRPAALSICADSWTPVITDALCLMGARVIFSPCAWAAEPGGEATNIAWIRETYRQRAAGRELYIVSANGVGPVTEGPWKGRVFQGNSLVTGPNGEALLKGPTNEPAILSVRL